MTLAPFKAARTLTWKRLTVWQPHRGDDGNLVTDDGDSLALDTWLPDGADELQFDAEHRLGMVRVDPEEIADTRDAVRRWCWHFLGRDDVRFEAD